MVLMARVRKASLEDVPAISAMWQEFMAEHDATVLEENKGLAPYVAKREEAAENYTEFLRKQIGGEGAALVAKEGGETAGYTLLLIKDEIPIFKIKKVGWISDLFVKKQFRGKGISTALMDKAIEWFKEKGVQHVSVPLYCDNKAAHSVYKKKGFLDYKLEMRKEI